MVGNGPVERHVTSLAMSAVAGGAVVHRREATDRTRPILLNNSTYEQCGIAASVSGARTGDWRRSILCWRSVRRRFRSPFLLFLVLQCTTTSPFVVGFARLPPEET